MTHSIILLGAFSQPRLMAVNSAEAMTHRVILLAIFSQLCLVAGQIFFKRAMRQTPIPQSRRQIFRELSLGILAQSVWFFTWVNLLEDAQLSRIFPFEGLNPVLIVVASWVVLKEQLSWNTAIGVLLICGGIFLASGS